MFIGGHKYNLNKLKIGIGVCSGILGIALINGVHSGVVHADAINWDNQNAESSNATADKVTSQSTNNVKTSNVQSTTSIKQNYVSALRVSPRVSNVQAGQVNKTKIAQFNSNSKIYGLNNSNTLSKNNGDGYVITNAGNYNGRSVDIGVTINNVQNNQGSYTTKWSNGDKATQTGQVDNRFEYQNGVTVNSNAVKPVINNALMRQRTEVQTVTKHNSNYAYVFGSGLVTNDYDISERTDLAQQGVKHSFSTNGFYVSPRLLDYIEQRDKVDEHQALKNLLNEMNQRGYNPDGHLNTVQYDSLIDRLDDSKLSETLVTPEANSNTVDYDDVIYVLEKVPLSNNRLNHSDAFTEGMFDMMIYDPDHITVTGTSDGIGGVVHHQGLQWSPMFNFASSNNSDKDDTYFDHMKDYDNDDDISYFIDQFKPDYIWQDQENVSVTDHLQIDQVKNGNLNYDYTIGLYDAQTGDLVTSLKSEYKNGVKVGRTASVTDTVMNNAIKNKIAEIRNGKANVAFNGTAANDDVAFYQETTPVQDTSKLTATVSRTITLHFPNNQKPASYNNVVNNNNQIVQTLKFTRTGTTDLVTGQTTYTNWQGDTKFPYILLPKIPGFKLQIN